jgi:DNA-binding MarR family transcriptional regulator
VGKNLPSEIPDAPPYMVRALLYLTVHNVQNIKMTKLANELAISLSWASRIVDGLFYAGFVTRTPDENDRRTIYVNLTATGAAIGTRLIEDREQPITSVLSESAPEKRVVVRKFLQTLTSELKARARS